MTQPTATLTGRIDEPMVIDAPVTTRHHRPRHTLAALTAFCAVLCVTQVLMLAAADWDTSTIAWWESIIVLYFVSGLTALWRQPHNPFGTLLILAGLGHWCAGLQTIPVAGLSAIGVLTKSLPIALMIHVILAFPTGRLPTWSARMAVIVAYCTSTVLEIPSALLTPDSPLFQPGLGSPLLLEICTAVQRVAGLLSLLLAIAVLWSRWIAMKRVRELTLGPFILYALACLIGIMLTVLIRLSGQFSVNGPEILQRIPQLQVVLIAFLPVVFLVGVLTGSFGRTGELREFLTDVGGRTLSPGELDLAAARATGIPGCRVVYSSDSGSGFVQPDGSPARNNPGENRYPIRYRHELVGALAYRVQPGVDTRLLETVAQACAVVMTHQRTMASLQAALHDLRRSDRALRQSRRRIAAAGDQERRRLARDLHDGLQQNAIMLGLRAQELQLAGEQHPGVAHSARAVRDGVVALLADLRNLIQGIMPASLIERGIGSALRALPGQFPVPLDVDVRGSARRLPAEIESTIYFCVLEGVTNAVKHAGAAAIQVVLTMTQDTVTAEVADDGVGGAMLGAGSGLVGLRDRLAAFGGTLTITSEPDSGTQLRMSIPCG